MEWRPIKEAITGHRMLLLDGEGNVRVGEVVSNGFMYGSDHLVVRSDLDFGDFCATAYWPNEILPTHWMPLPEPLKEDK